MKKINLIFSLFLIFSCGSYKFCTGLSINLYPQKIGNTDPVRETRSWYNLIGEVVQSLYGLLFEQSSPSIPVAIDCKNSTSQLQPLKKNLT